MFHLRLQKFQLSLLGLLLCVALGIPATAQDTQQSSITTAQNASEQNKKPPKAKKEKSWKTSVAVKGRVDYDSNVFLLSDGAKSLLNSPGAAEQISGRFTNMSQAEDIILTPGIKLKSEGPGAGGRKMTFKAGVDFHVFSQNTERNNLELDLSLAQKASKRGTVEAKFTFTPSYFQRNYLTGAVDSDLDLNITEDEKRFSGATYSTYGFSGGYRYRFGKRSSLRVGVGYLNRSYDNAILFAGRDRTAPYADVSLTFGSKKAAIEFGAKLLAVDSLRGMEIVLLDETAFGVDFNGDLDTADLAVQTMQQVDRTHTQQRFKVKIKLNPSKSTDWELGFQRRRRNFSSHEPFDVAHLDRTDDRDRFHFAWDRRVASRVSMKLGFFYATQKKNKVGDPGSTGEINDYTRFGGNFGLSIRF